MVFFSLWGGMPGGENLPHQSRVIRLGWQSDNDVAVRLALSRTALALDEDSKLQYVEVRWTDSLFSGFDPDEQGVLFYDRSCSQLLEDGAGHQKGNDPDEDWKEVNPSVIKALAQRGFFSERLLRTAGCHSNLP